MKKAGLAAFALTIALALCSCSMLDRSYSSSTDHVDYPVTEDSSILRVESYQALVNSILYYVSEHSGGGTIRLYNYTGNVENDLAAACSEVMERDPLGSYAVRTINYKSTRILTYYEVELRIAYRHTLGEVAAIQPVSGQNGVRQRLTHLVERQLSHTVMRPTYFTGDEEFVSDLFWLALYSDPIAAARIPEITVSFYPKEGSQRILEVEVRWPVADTPSDQHRQAMENAALLLTAETPPVGEQYTVEELVTMLRTVLNYDPSGSHTALAALHGEPVNDLGTLLAMEYLCHLYGTEATPVFDTAGAQMWLIVSTPSGYRHLLPRYLRPVQEGEEPTCPLYTDEELTVLGFTWPANLHPACVDYSGAVPE